MGIVTILWEKWTEFRRDFCRITLSALITPVMYLLVFGLGISAEAQGRPYLQYLIPGLVAMTSMNGSFNAIAQPLNVQRLYEKAFDQVIISPTPLWQFLLGQVIAGSLRGLYACGLILLLVWPMPTGLVFNGYYFLVLFVNGAVFSALGVVVSFLAKSHADVPRFSGYFMMPMAFLCNTFFSSDHLPRGFREVVGILPLSEASGMVRHIAYGEAWNPMGIMVLLCYLLLLTALGLWFVYQKQNL